MRHQLTCVHTLRALLCRYRALSQLLDQGRVSFDGFCFDGFYQDRRALFD
ncbi:MAG: hypothetical protein AAF607_00315 [Pseudomonadota bacterium]